MISDNKQSPSAPERGLQSASVAQAGSLLYRRLAVGWAREKMETGERTNALNVKVKL
jgi:hypothetical protein